MIDRCSWFAWSRCCTEISPIEAAASLAESAKTSPFPLAGAAIVVDGRSDVQSPEFAHACRAAQLSPRPLVGGRPWGNSCVEQFHRFVRIAGLGGLPFDQLQSWESVVDYVRVFTNECNSDRSLIFATSSRLAPLEILRGMRELAHLPALQRAVYCRLLNEKDVERAKPMRVSPGGDGPLFEPIAEALQPEHRSSRDLEAVMTCRKIKHKFAPGEREGVRRVPNKNQRGFYLYV